MKKYINVYSFQVIGKIEEGKIVYCIDKQECKVIAMNFVSVEILVTLLKNSEKEENYGRYEFYYIEEGEAENGNI